MATWGGPREGAGRPQEFDNRVAVIVYMDKLEREELRRWCKIVADYEDVAASTSSLLRFLALDWIEEQRKQFKDNA